MSALADVLADHFMFYDDDKAMYECLDPQGDCHASFGDPQRWREHLIAEVAAAGLVVIQLPVVACKGPQDTDANFFRQVADRMDDPSRRLDYLSGSNVRHAVRTLLYRVAAAAEAVRS